MNLFYHKRNIKNAHKQELNIPENLEGLNKWTIPRIDFKTVYQLGTFEKLGLKQVVKTTEESVSLDNEETELKLLSSHDINRYKDLNKFIHIGLVQIAFKPLTQEGLAESFIACLRDARNLNWKLERIGHIQSKTEYNIDNITQTPEGTVYIQMGHTPSQLGNIPRTFSTRSERSYISPLIEDKDYIPYRVSTSQVSEGDEQNHHVDKVFKTTENIVKGIYNTKDAEITESEMNFSL